MTEIDTTVISMRALRAVAAVADAGSFTGAALRLGLGQSAVSHAVARLERALSVELFVRRRDGVEPTDAASRLLGRVRPALAEIDAAIDDAVHGADGGAVTISVSTSLATHWLIPRLAEFKQQHPDIDLRVLTTDTDRDVGRDDADLWIPLGTIVDPALESAPFCAERLVPVAAPSLAERLANPTPADLLGAPLLHLEERYNPRFDWPRWFRDQGVRIEGDLPGDRSNDYSLILHGALAGNGVALGWEHIVGELIDDGRLVAVGPATDTGVPFPLLNRRTKALDPGVVVFREWLITNAPGEAV